LFLYLRFVLRLPEYYPEYAQLGLTKEQRDVLITGRIIMDRSRMIGRRIMMFTAIIMASMIIPALFLIACAITVNIEILLSPKGFS
jgi:hypothetical protein